jgi:hypothetical protein
MSYVIIPQNQLAAMPNAPAQRDDYQLYFSGAKQYLPFTGFGVAHGHEAMTALLLNGYVFATKGAAQQWVVDHGGLIGAPITVSEILIRGGRATKIGEMVTDKEVLRVNNEGLAKQLLQSAGFNVEGF